MAAFPYTGGATNSWCSTGSNSGNVYVTNTSSGGSYTIRSGGWDSSYAQSTNPNGYEESILRDQNSKLKNELERTKNELEDKLRKAQQLIEKLTKDPVESLKTKVRVFELGN